MFKEKIFGLRKSQLQSIVDCIAGEPVVSFEMDIRDVDLYNYGSRGEKLIATFTYTATAGHAGQVNVFVKQQASGFQESHHYYYLTKHQAPIPKMYGALTNENKQEIIFIEYLDTDLDYDAMLNEPSQFREFLSLIARFNAIQPSQEYRTHLPYKPYQDVEYLQKWLSDFNQIWVHACRGDFGESSKQLCANFPNQLPQIQEFLEQLVSVVGQMEPGLCHRDLEPHHAGRSTRTGELLLFDLSDVAFGPRFWDVAGWCDVAGCCLCAPDDPPPHGIFPKKLAEYYLEEYVHWGGCPVLIDRFLEETKVLYFAWTLNFLGMIFDGWRSRNPIDRAELVSHLHRELNTLLNAFADSSFRRTLLSLSGTTE
ncbi:phosphotransferase [bacterium]|nr:phosphotransferase [bacterium]